MWEQQYLDAIQDIMTNGISSDDRTGVGTKYKFGVQMRYDLTDMKMPIITTKKVFWRGVAEELLWFISGNTSAKTLADKDIHIWDGNVRKDNLASIGITDPEEGDLGPIYGFQWRHFGAEYKGCQVDYEGQGVDQLTELVETIKKDPNSRRLILTAWNPKDLKAMALPPCHMTSQFDVNGDQLSCLFYQRSADMGLGVPFNIASYALLTHLIAHVTGLKAKELVHVIGNAHVYNNHFEGLAEQVKRTPGDYSKLVIKRHCTNLTEFIYSDFELVGYKCQEAIKLPFNA